MPVPGGVWHCVQAHMVPRMIAQTPIVTSFLTGLSFGEGERLYDQGAVGRKNPDICGQCALGNLSTANAAALEYQPFLMASD
jgi:hypothetical protein